MNDPTIRCPTCQKEGHESTVRLVRRFRRGAKTETYCHGMPSIISPGTRTDAYVCRRTHNFEILSTRTDAYMCRRNHNFEILS
jgi:hypothetical protein